MKGKLETVWGKKKHLFTGTAITLCREGQLSSRRVKGTQTSDANYFSSAEGGGDISYSL